MRIVRYIMNMQPEEVVCLGNDAQRPIFGLLSRDGQNEFPRYGNLSSEFLRIGFVSFHEIDNPSVSCGSAARRRSSVMVSPMRVSATVLIDAVMNPTSPG